MHKKCVLTIDNTHDMCYNIITARETGLNKTERGKAMSKKKGKKKSSRKLTQSEKVLLATAILNLISTVVLLIARILDLTG